jgi:hypothetical protein
MSRFKKLSVPSRFKNLENYNRLYGKNHELKDIAPIFNKNGFYFDRLNKSYWVEVNGRAFTVDKLDVEFQNKFNYYDSTILNVDQVKVVYSLLACKGVNIKYLRMATKKVLEATSHRQLKRHYKLQFMKFNK